MHPGGHRQGGIGPNPNIAPYGSYVEFGTKPHDIVPGPGRVLVFTMNGQKIFARKVHHPGTKAQPYVEPAFQAWVDSLGTMAAEANIKVIKDNAPSSLSRGPITNRLLAELGTEGFPVGDNASQHPVRLAG